MKKRILSCMIIFMLLLSMLNISVLAENEQNTIIMTVSDSSLSYANSTGEAEQVYTDANGISYISFNAGDYQVFDFNLETSGTYIITVYAGLSQEGPVSSLSFYDFTKEEYKEVSRKAIIPSGSYSTYGATVMGEFELSAGANRLKLKETFSDIHLSYIEITQKTAPEPIALSVADNYDSYNASDGGKEKILSITKGKYSQFTAGDYYIFDIEVPYSGTYDISLFAALKTGSAETEIYVYDEAEGNYNLVICENITVNGSILSFGETEMGKISLNSGTNKIKILQKTSEIRFSSIEAVYIEEAQQEKKDVRESSESYNAGTGKAEGIAKCDNGYLVSFNSGDTQDFIFYLKETGEYSVTVHAGLSGSAKTALYVYNEKTDSYKELATKDIVPSGDLNVFGPTEMGEFKLTKGLNRLRLKQIQSDIHLHAIEVKYLESPETIEMDVSESSESYSNGTDGVETVYKDSGGNAYVSFNAGDYQVFDFDIKRSGSYRISLIEGLASAGPISAVSLYNSDTENYDELIKRRVDVTGGLSVYGESLMGEFNLSEGEHKLKVLQIYSDIHLSGIKIEYAGSERIFQVLDVTSCTSTTATADDGGGLIFETPQYADYTMEISESGNYEIVAFATECYLRVPQISVWENNIELVSARIPDYRTNDICLPINLGTVNLEAGEHNFRVRHSGVTASKFLLEKIVFTKSDTQKEVVVAGISLLMADMASDCENVSVSEDSIAQIDANGFLKYDAYVAEEGYFRLDITCADEEKNGITIAQNENVVGYINVSDGRGVAFVKLEKGDCVLDFGFTQDAEFEMIKLTHLPYITEELEADFAEQINSAKYAKDIKAVLEECSDIYALDLQNAEDGIFYKDAIYAGLLGRNFENAQSVICEFERLSREEKTNPCAELLNDGRRIDALESGNLSLVVSADRIRENLSVMVAIYDGARLKHIFKGDYDGTNQSITVPMGNLSFSGEETIKIIALDSLEEISPLNIIENVQAEFFVSPTGNDENSGAEDAPVKTVKKAMELVAEQTQNLTGDIIVNLAEGVYFEGETLIFDETQGGNDVYSVTWQGSGEETVISGGKQVTGWQSAGGAIFKAPLEAVDVRNLYVNGYPATKARSECAFWVEEAVASEETTLSFDSLVIKDEYFPTSISKPQDLEVVLDASWETQRFPAKDVVITSESATIVLDETVLAHNTPVEGTALGGEMMIYLENAKELLDKPGEFYYDKEEGYIYYYPLETEDINSAEIIAPQTEGLVSVCGTDTQSKTKNLKFKDMSFKFGAWNYPSESGYIGTQSDVYTNTQTGESEMIFPQFAINNAEKIVIENCLFTCLGSTAVGIEQGAENVEIVKNRFRDIAASGIYAGSFSHTTSDSSAQRVKNVLIENNSFKRTSFEFRSCSAVSLYYVNNVKVSHNLISELPYSGMTAGWGWGGADPEGWGNITIANNHIENVMQCLDDGGGVYILGHMRNSNIVGNYFNKIGRTSSSMYADSGSGYAQFKGNVSTNSRQWLTIANIGLHDVRVRNNFSDTTRGLITSADYINEGNVNDIDPDNLPEAAQEIVNNAGIMEEYAYLEQGNELPEGRITMVNSAPKLPYYEGYKFEAEDCKSYTSGVVYANAYLGINNQHSAKFDVTVPSAGKYKFRAFVATPGTTSQLAVVQNGTAVITADVICTGSYAVYKMLDAGEITLPAGTSEITVKSAKSAFHIDCFVLEPIE